jgi:hypothetical protein
MAYFPSLEDGGATARRRCHRVIERLGAKSRRHEAHVPHDPALAIRFEGVIRGNVKKPTSTRGSQSTDARRPITAYDVTDLAGVSQSAVRRAFTPGASVAATTKSRIMEAARQLN